MGCSGSKESSSTNPLAKKLSVLVLGSTGKAGSEIVKELKKRGHTVTAAARDTGKVVSPYGLKLLTVDYENLAAIKEQIAKSDVVVMAYAPPNDNVNKLVDVTTSLKDIISEAENKNIRLVMVGGAGGLEVVPPAPAATATAPAADDGYRAGLP